MEGAGGEASNDDQARNARQSEYIKNMQSNELKHNAISSFLFLITSTLNKKNWLLVGWLAGYISFSKYLI